MPFVHFILYPGLSEPTWYFDGSFQTCPLVVSSWCVQGLRKDGVDVFN